MDNALICPSLSMRAQRQSASAGNVSAGKSDREVAHSLSSVELTERLSETKLSSWMADARGAKTRESLFAVADVSAFLAPPCLRKQTLYAADGDFVFASYALHGKQPRSGSVLVRDYVRPAAIRAGILIEEDGGLYSKDGEVVSRFWIL